MGLFDLIGSKAVGGTRFLQWTINNAGEWVYPDNKANEYIGTGYKALPNIYSIISLILSKTTIVPFEIYRVKSTSKELKYKAVMNDPRNAAKAIRYKNEAYDKIEDSEIERLLLNPNNYQSLSELWWEIDGYKLLTGNSYIYGPEIGNKPKELHSIPAPCVSLIVKGGPFSPEFSYEVDYLNSELPGEEMYHFKYWNPILSGSDPSKQYLGQSPLQACRLLMGRYKDADIAQGFMFKNQGPAGILSGDGSSDSYSTAGQQQALAIQDRFRQQHQSPTRINDIIVTPSKVSWTATGLSPVDLNILESKREALSEVCNVFNVPIGLLSDTNSTENNMIESRKALITDAVIPVIEARKQVLNKFLAPKFGADIRIEFDYTVFHELQDDLEKQARALSMIDEITPNEKRSALGYDQMKDPNMDKIYMSQGKVPLDELGTPIEEIDETLL